MGNSCAPVPRRSRAAHAATITHAAPGEATVTCHCHTLNATVDVDDPAIAEFVLWEHLNTTSGAQLKVTDTRTGRRYAVTAANEPETRLILTAARGPR
jgi:hypothetical protein